MVRVFVVRKPAKNRETSGEDEKVSDSKKPKLVLRSGREIILLDADSAAKIREEIKKQIEIEERTIKLIDRDNKARWYAEGRQTAFNEVLGLVKE